MRRLGRDSIVYAGGTLLARLVSFVMLPVYTRYLTPADYGILQLLDITLDIAAILVSAGALAGVTRFYFKTDDPERRRRLLSTAFLTQLGLNLLGTAGVFLLATPIWRMLLDGEGSPWFVRVAAANFTLGILANVPLLLLQLRQQAARFVTLSVVKLFLQLSLNIVFVVVLRSGPFGVLLSTFVANLVFGGVLCVGLLRHTGIHFDRGIFRELRKFGLPYQFEKAGTFIIAFGDRFFLKAFRGLAEVGVYGVAYQFGFLLTGSIARPLYRAWNPQRHQLAGLPRKERDARYNRGFRLINLVLVSASTAIALGITPMLGVMVTPEFFVAARYVPIIILASLFQIWTGTVGLGITITERTHYAAWATYIATGTVLLLYVVLIPPYGAMGAAVATLVSQLARFLAYYYWSHRLWPVSYDWRPHLVMLGLGTGATLLHYGFAPEGIVGSGALAAALFLGYAAGTWFLALPRADRVDLREALLSRAGITRLLSTD